MAKKYQGSTTSVLSLTITIKAKKPTINKTARNSHIKNFLITQKKITLWQKTESIRLLNASRYSDKLTIPAPSVLSALNAAESRHRLKSNP